MNYKPSDYFKALFVLLTIFAILGIYAALVADNDVDVDLGLVITIACIFSLIPLGFLIDGLVRTE